MTGLLPKVIGSEEQYFRFYSLIFHDLFYWNAHLCDLSIWLFFIVKTRGNFLMIPVYHKTQRWPLDFNVCFEGQKRCYVSSILLSSYDRFIWQRSGSLNLWYTIHGLKVVWAISLIHTIRLITFDIFCTPQLRTNTQDSWYYCRKSVNGGKRYWTF